eukprot:2509500-Rhodomonas_salina.2
MHRRNLDVDQPEHEAYNDPKCAPVLSKLRETDTTGTARYWYYLYWVRLVPILVPTEYYTAAVLSGTARYYHRYHEAVLATIQRIVKIQRRRPMLLHFVAHTQRGQ